MITGKHLNRIGIGKYGLKRNDNDFVCAHFK